MDIYWVEQSAPDVPNDDGWLSAAEASHASRLRIARRRADWRLGRWTAKNAIAACLAGTHPDLASVELRPAPSGAPEVFIADQPSAFTVSLSHRGDRAICAVTPNLAAVGCDLEVTEQRSQAFVGDYFTEAEQASIAGVAGEYRWQMIALLWSAKESALKALKLGLRVDTRSLQVAPSFVPEPHGWCWLNVETGEQRAFDGWWRSSGDFVETVVAHPRPAPPIILEVRASSLHRVRTVTEKKVVLA